jgi:hypothetical protein
VDVDANGDPLAVDEHAVAVEDDQFEGQKRRSAPIPPTGSRS